MGSQCLGQSTWPPMSWRKKHEWPTTTMGRSGAATCAAAHATSRHVPACGCVRPQAAARCHPVRMGGAQRRRARAACPRRGRACGRTCSPYSCALKRSSRSCGHERGWGAGEAETGEGRGAGGSRAASGAPPCVPLQRPWQRGPAARARARTLNASLGSLTSNSPRAAQLARPGLPYHHCPAARSRRSTAAICAAAAWEARSC
jgi:hypothetical protein